MTITKIIFINVNNVMMIVMKKEELNCVQSTAQNTRSIS